MTDFSGRAGLSAPRPPAGGPPGGAAGGDDRLRVMVVDDSAIIRGLLTRTLESDPLIRVVASVGDGQMALNTVARQPVDVIVLDIEMPVMDGLTALPKLAAAAPHAKIVMASTLTAKNADISLRAMANGAADYVTKPSSTRELGGAELFKRELVEKVKALGTRARQGNPNATAPAPLRAAPGGAAPAGAPASGAGTPAPTILNTLRARGEPAQIRLQPAKTDKPDIIAIGSSTGGPQALFEVLGHLAGVPQPILITQHMPPTFTTILAEHITRQCRLTCAEGVDGEPIVGGRAYVAPGDFHMTVVQKGGVNCIALSKDPPENFCRPAVDPMMRSIVRAYGRRILAIILTGMGQDGMKGCDGVVAAGGQVLAQDEASSVVWGMPGAVAMAGLCSAVLPLKELGPHIRKLALRTAA
ncbi:MAG TPA: chemotaxis response regulator protein-glutamate methylesterase [Alphaproteobacteria bacterium]|nr:chemotaxis response regulator protein-glutamate methylesterase [Alphaproteobacteria bacterium]